jgi:hypothetical protein
MIALYREPQFTFRFDDDRVVSRFHLEGVEAGRRVGVFKLDATNPHGLGRITAATVGAGGWVDVPEPILVRVGEGFVVVPEDQT